MRGERAAGDAPYAIQTGPLAVNTYIVPIAGDDVLVIDSAASSLTGDEEAVVSYLKAQNLHPVGIFLTHGHFDHILGIPALTAAFDGITVAISSEDEIALTDKTLSFHQGTLGMMGDDGAIAAALHDAADAARGRIKTFRGGQTLEDVFGGSRKKGDGAEGNAEAGAGGGEVADAGSSAGADAERRELTGDGESKEAGAEEGKEAGKSPLAQWRIIASPGHTAGSVCLYNSAGNGGRGCLFSGDTVFFRGWGRTDMGGDEGALMKSLAALKKTIPPQTLVFPGHDRYGFPLCSWSMSGW